MMGATTLDKIVIRFYLGNEHDETISRYLSQFNNTRQGAKPDEIKRLAYRGLQVEQEDRPVLDRDAIRSVIREAMGETQSVLIDALASPDLDPAMVRQIVQQALKDVAEEISVKGNELSFSLTDIRRVVEVVIREQLDRLKLSPVAQKPSDDDEDEEAKKQRIDAKLSKFEASMEQWSKV
ncbi:MAG: hypothetical protein GY832_24950 [Chloroflexi bacterium]|nr:hypothetical protein [Chloroflexota bacterium]